MISFAWQTPKRLFENIKQSIYNYTHRAQIRVAGVLEENVKDVFKLQGARGDNPRWEPTTDIAKRYRFVNRDAPTMIDSGNLRDSIKASVKKEKGEVWVSVSMAQYGYEHNDGEHQYTPPTLHGNFSNKTYTVPQRRILFLTNEDFNDVQREFANTPIRVRA